MADRQSSSILNPFTITVVYLVTGCLWIAFSDKFVEAVVDDLALMSRIQTYKGWFFILITASFLYLLMHIQTSRLKKSGKFLKRSELRYRNLVENSGYAILLFDRTQKLHFASPVIRQVLGFEPEEMIADMNLTDFIQPDHMPRMHDSINKLYSAGDQRITMELEWRRKNGSWIWTECIVSHFRGDDVEDLILFQIRDISQSRELSHQAGLSHKKFESLFQNAPVGFHICGADRKIHEINKTELEMLGYSREEVVDKMSWSDLIVDEDKIKFEKRWQRLLKTGFVSNGHYTVRTKSGNLIRIVKNARLIHDDMLGGINVISNVVDITEKTRAEELVKESEAKYRFLFKGNPSPLWIFDEKTLEFLDVNDRAIDQYGYTREEFLSMTLMDIRPEEDIPVLTQWLNKSGSGIQNSGIWRHKKKDGTIFRAEVIVHPLHLNGKRVELVLANDVDDRFQAEQELRDSEAKFRKLAQTIDAVVIIYRGENFEFINRGTEVITGYTIEELSGKKFWEIVHPDHQKLTRERGLARQRGEAAESRYDFKIIRKDGEERWLSYSASRIVYEGGNAALGTGFDITERKQAEMKIRDLNRNLEQRVQERTYELEALNSELEAFSYSVSHDLMAPLRVIDGFSQALLDNYDDKLDEEGRKYLSRIRTGTQKMGELIGELLNLSRITRTGMQMQLVNISTLAAQVIADLAAEESEPVRKYTFICDEDIIIYGDEGLFQVVLANLLGNSWKFSSYKEKTEISVRRLTGTEPGFTVQDNGAGFNMNYYEKLFTPFQRLHKNSEFEGTGIGLATVYRIIRRHGGSIEASSIVGVGTEFHVRIPASDPDLISTEEDVISQNDDVIK